MEVTELSGVDLASVLLTIAHEMVITSDQKDAMIEAACRLNDMNDV